MTVIAGVRDPSADSAKALSSLPVGKGSKVIIVKLDSNSEGDARTAAEALQSVEYLDIIIANAGISNSFGGVMDATTEQLREHINVNAIGE